MRKDRDNFPATVASALAKRAAYICSNPDCRAQTLAPSDANQAKFLYIGKAAHISAAATGGPRYDSNMTPEARAAAENGIFLCSSCADLIDKNNGLDFPVDRLRSWKTMHEQWVLENLNKRAEGRGGDGGGGTIVGNRGVVVGGKGGRGGVSGKGGDGGSGFIQGDDGLIIGGDGGSCFTPDGRGGRGALGPTERLGFPSTLWGYGRGGPGANHPEFDRRLSLLQQILQEYLTTFAERRRFIEAGIDRVPEEWVNQRLSEIGEDWRVTAGPDGFELPPLLELRVWDTT